MRSSHHGPLPTCHGNIDHGNKVEVGLYRSRWFTRQSEKCQCYLTLLLIYFICLFMKWPRGAHVIIFKEFILLVLEQYLCYISGLLLLRRRDINSLAHVPPGAYSPKISILNQMLNVTYARFCQDIFIQAFGGICRVVIYQGVCFKGLNPIQSTPTISDPSLAQTAAATSFSWYSFKSFTT